MTLHPQLRVAGETPTPHRPDVASACGDRDEAADPARKVPARALADLLSGNRRFASGSPRYGHHVANAAAQSRAQQPYAVVAGCIDSRVPLEAVFDQNFGSITVVRTGAHVLDNSIVGSIEFAVSLLEVSLVMVLGHERCGAVAATVDAMRSGDKPGGALGYLVEEIAPAVAAAGVHEADVHAKAMRAHVGRTVARLREVERLAEAEAEGRVQIVGAVYDLDTGVVTVL